MHILKTQRSTKVLIYRNVQIVKSKVLLEPGKDESGIKGPQRCTSRNQCIVNAVIIEINAVIIVINAVIIVITIIINSNTIAINPPIMSRIVLKVFK